MTAEKKENNRKTRERDLTAQVDLKVHYFYHHLPSLSLNLAKRERIEEKKVTQKCKIIRFNAERKKEAIVFPL